MVQSKADIHIHTTASDGLQEPEEIVDYAASHTDLQVIAITDHDTVEGAHCAYQYWRKNRQRFSNLEVIRGIEVSSADGHILGLFVEETIPSLMSAIDTVCAIHEQGGIAIAAHPFTPLEWILSPQGVGKVIGEVAFDGVETLNSVPLETFANRKTATFNRANRQLPELGGSDAHYKTMIGNAYTAFDGVTSADFRMSVQSGRVRAGGKLTRWTIGFEVLQYMVKTGKRLNFKRPHPSQVLSS